MGADLLLASTSAPHITPTVRRNIEAWCDEHLYHPASVLDIAREVGHERIERGVLTPDIIEDWQVDFESFAEEGDTPETHAARRLHDAVDKVIGPYRRDLATFQMPNGRDELITGGMSWGDAPTEAFEYIETLAAVDLYAKPISIGEAHRALRKLAGL